MLLAYLRGWITTETQKQGIRSQLRQELILSALASELDAEVVKSQALAYSGACSAFKLTAEGAAEITRTIIEDLDRAGRLREFDRVKSVNAATARAPTIDGLFKLYQAFLDTGIITKTK